MLHTNGCRLTPAGMMLVPYMCRCQALLAAGGPDGTLFQDPTKSSGGSTLSSSGKYTCECGRTFTADDDGRSHTEYSSDLPKAGNISQQATVFDASPSAQHAESPVKKLETRISALQAESNSLSAQVTATAMNLESSNSALLANNAALQGQLTAGGMAIVNLATTNSTLMIENSTLQAQVASASVLMENLEHTNSTLVTHNDDLLVQITAAVLALKNSESSKAVLQAASSARIGVLENLISHMQQIITAPVKRMQGPLQPQTDAECMAALVTARDDAMLQVSKLAGKVRKEEHKVLILESAADTAVLQASIAAAQITLLEMVIQRVTLKGQKHPFALGPTLEMPVESDKRKEGTGERSGTSFGPLLIQIGSGSNPYTATPSSPDTPSKSVRTPYRRSTADSPSYLDWSAEYQDSMSSSVRRSNLLGGGWKGPGMGRGPTPGASWLPSHRGSTSPASAFPRQR